MAKTIKVIGQVGGGVASDPTSFDLRVKAGTAASIKPGYLVIKDGSNAGYVAAAPDATASTAEIIGIAGSTSTDTATADGTVQVITAPSLLVEIFAKTPASLAATMLYDQFILDVTSGNYTLDQATATNGIFRLISYDATTGRCIATLHTNY